MSGAAPSRGVWGSLLVLGLIWLGLVGGTAVGAALFVPEGSGLAGPAIALGYGVAAAVAGIVAGALVAWRARPGTVRAVAKPVLLLSLVAVAVLAWRIATLERSSPAPSPELRPKAVTAP